MNVGAISRRYAKALYAYALENQKEELVYKQVKRLIRHYLRVPELRQVVENPTIDRRQKLAFLEEASKRGVTCDVLSRFLEMVLDSGREKLLLFMFYSFLNIYRMEKNIHRGKLITAVPLPESTKEMLRQLITERMNGTIEFDTKVNPELLGGCILFMEFHRVDASVASQLQGVKKQFIDKNRRIV